MSVATCLECDQEKRETNNGQDPTHEVNTFDDLLGRETFSTGVNVREVREEQSQASDSVVDK